ncbi:DUF4158 domain-containing protein [Candidatus Nitrospira salsa]
MPRMDIITAIERKEFDSPPVFSLPQQHHYFDPPLDVIRTLKSLRTPTNQVYFLVSYGYFRATARFYPPAQFRTTDLAYVSQSLGWSFKQLNLASYASETPSRHRHLIRTLRHFRWYDRMARKMMVAEIRTLAKVHWDPRQIFFRVVDRLTATRIEIPGSDYLSRLIATAVTQRQGVFAQRLGHHLTPLTRQELHALLMPSQNPSGHDRYRLSQLKRLSQSTKPNQVRARLNSLEQIRTLYHLLAPLLPLLELPPTGITYYVMPRLP